MKTRARLVTGESDNDHSSSQLSVHTAQSRQAGPRRWMDVGDLLVSRGDMMFPTRIDPRTSKRWSQINVGGFVSSQPFSFLVQWSSLCCVTMTQWCPAHIAAHPPDVSNPCAGWPASTALSSSRAVFATSVRWLFHTTSSRTSGKSPIPVVAKVVMDGFGSRMAVIVTVQNLVMGGHKASCEVSA